MKEEESYQVKDPKTKDTETITDEQPAEKPDDDSEDEDIDTSFLDEML